MLELNAGAILEAETLVVLFLDKALLTIQQEFKLLGDQLQQAIKHSVDHLPKLSRLLLQITLYQVLFQLLTQR